MRTGVQARYHCARTGETSGRCDAPLIIRRLFERPLEETTAYDCESGLGGKDRKFG